MVAELWNIQRLAHLHKSLHTHTSVEPEMQDKTQPGTNFLNSFLVDLQENYKTRDTIVKYSC